MPGAATAGQVGKIEYGPPVWTNIGSGMSDGAVAALAFDGTNLYAGGTFTNAEGMPVNCVAKWNGTNWTNLGNGVTGTDTYNNISYVCDVVYDGTSLFAGGSFTNAGGVAVNRMAKWDGTSWTNLGSGMDHVVFTLAHDGTNLFAGGFFTSPGHSVAKWNGSSWIGLGSGMVGSARSVDALTYYGTNLYASGGFTNAGGVTANRVAMWNGTSWTNLGSGLNYSGQAMAHDGTNLYVGGGGARSGPKYVAKWNGSSWTSLGSGMNSDVRALVYAGTNLYAGGSFTNAGGVAANNHVAMWNGTSWTNLGSGMNNVVEALAYDGTNLYAGGWFTDAGGVEANRVAKWAPTTIITSGVEPSSGSWTGGFQVVISGSELGNGSDVTNVTLCGVSVSNIISQSATQVVVVAGAGIPGPGTVCVFSTSHGVSESVVSNAFTYLRESQAALVFNPASPQAYHSTNGLSVSGGSGNGTVSCAILSGPGIIEDGTNLVVTASSGTIQIQATKAQDDFYFEASVTGAVEATKGNQTITFPALDNKITTDTVGLSATASSGLEVSFAVGSGLASIDGTGTNLTFAGAGEVGIVASQAGDADWNPASDVTNTFAVMKAPAGITLNDLAQIYDGTPRTVTATTVPPGLTVDVTYNGSGTAPIAAGSYVVTGTVDDAMYQGILEGTLVVSKAPAEVYLQDLAQTYDGMPKPISATTDPSGLTVEFTYDGGATAPIVVGSYAVTGTVNDANFAGTNSGTLTVSKAGQTINFPAIDDQYITNVVVLSATASSGLAVSFAVQSGPGSLAGTTLTFTGAGEVTVVASQAGDNNWNPAPDVTNAFYAESAVPAFNATSVNVREEGEGRFYLRLSQAPEANVTVQITRGSGDENLSVKSGGTQVFTPANWDAWRLVTLQATADENGDDEQAVFQVAMAGARPRTVTATALDIDIGLNLALSSAGTTITMTNAVLASNLIDGVHMNGTNYGYTVWTNVPPGTMNMDLHTTALVSRVRLLNFDWNFRAHRYTLESSSNGVDWAMLADASAEEHRGWDDWAVEDLPIRYLRFTGLSNTSNRAVCIAELEVYSEAAALQQDQTIDFPQIPDQQTTNVVELAATASSGLPVSLHVASGPASLDGTTLTFTGVGVVTIVASQAGDADWKPAPEVTNSFYVELTTPFLLKSAVNVREGGEGRFFLRLNMAPTSTVVTKITFASGDTNVWIQNGATQTFTPANWSVWRIATFQAGEDENSTGETATFHLTMPGIRTRLINVTVLDDEIGENIALASAGTTISWTNAVLVTNLIDGVHMVSTNYGYTKWTNDPPGYMVLDLGGLSTVTHVRVLNFDWSYRVHQYLIESSMNGVDWSTAADASTGEHTGWESFEPTGQSMRYLRLTGLSNSANNAVCFAELEVYGEHTPARRRLVSTSVPGGVGSMPVSVATSDGLEDDSGWNAVDGDFETAWVGQKAGGGYILVEYGPALSLKTLEVDLAEGSLTNIAYFYSLDARNWQSLPDDLEKNPVILNFLWLVLPDDGTDAVSRVLEICPNP